MPGTSLFLIYFAGIMEHGTWSLDAWMLGCLERRALEHEEKMNRSFHGRKHEDGANSEDSLEF